MAKIKNIIFIIADTTRAKNIGLNGATPSPTPNLDSLGKKSIVFTNAYTTITKSDPSITAIMSGRYPMATGLISHGQWIMEEQEKALVKIPFLAEILKKHGFYTAAVDYFARWHDRGFTYYSGKLTKDIEGDKIAGRNITFIEILRLIDAITFRIFKRDLFVRFYYCFFPKVVVPYDTADVVVNEAISILKKKEKENLYLYLHFRDPHSPFMRPTGLRSYLFDSIEERYSAEIKFMDREIGRLIEYLEVSKRINETLIVFTADHGENLTEHNIYIAHHDPYETVVKIPLLLFHPLLGHKVVKGLVQNIDIFPTILSLFGISLPKEIDGINLLPFIKSGKKSIRKYVFFDDNFFGHSFVKRSFRKLGVRLGNYKYIQTHYGKKNQLFQRIPTNTHIAKEEVYKVDTDPAEKDNLVQKNQEVKEVLKKLLKTQIDTFANL